MSDGGLGMIGNLISVFEAAKDVGSAVHEWKNRPRLRIERVYVANFSVPKSKDFRVARFVIATIRNAGGVSARECLGVATSEVRELKEYKLHWSDTEYRPFRDIAEAIDIPPGISRDLDVAFSVGEVKAVGSIEARTQISYPGTRTSGSVPAIGTTVVNTFPQVSPAFGTVPSTRVDVSVPPPSIFDEEKQLSGACIATPLALCYPQEKSESHLSPGSHSLKINVRPSDSGDGDEINLRIVSKESWQELAAEKL